MSTWLQRGQRPWTDKSSGMAVADLIGSPLSRANARTKLLRWASILSIEAKVKVVPRIKRSATQVTGAASAPSGAAVVTHRFDGFAVLVCR
jgi:hypothetical protein